MEWAVRVRDRPMRGKQNAVIVTIAAFCFVRYFLMEAIFRQPPALSPNY